MSENILKYLISWFDINFVGTFRYFPADNLIKEQNILDDIFL